MYAKLALIATVVAMPMPAFATSSNIGLIAPPSTYTISAQSVKSARDLTPAAQCDSTHDDHTPLQSFLGSVLRITPDPTIVASSCLVSTNPTPKTGWTTTIIHSDVSFAEGASITVDVDATLQIAGNVTAPPTQQIFVLKSATGHATGKVLLPGQDSPVYPEWFGAQGVVSVDSQPAFQAAVDSLAAGGTINVLPGNYLLKCQSSAAAVQFGNQIVNVQGAGSNRSVLYPAQNCHANLFFSYPAGTNQTGYVRDIQFNGNQAFVDATASWSSGSLSLSVTTSGVGNPIEVGEEVVTSAMGPVPGIPYGATVASVSGSGPSYTVTLNANTVFGSPANTTSSGSSAAIRIAWGYLTQGWTAIDCQNCGIADYTNIKIYEAGTGMNMAGLMNSTVQQIFMSGCTAACFVLGGGSVNSPPSPPPVVVVENATENKISFLTLGPSATATAGLILDSGSAENRIENVIEAGGLNGNGSTTAYHAHGGILMQNTSVGGNKPASNRMWDMNIDANTDFNIKVTNAFNTEIHDSEIGRTVSGPGVWLAGIPSTYADIDGFKIIGSKIRGAANDTVKIDHSSNVAIRDNEIYHAGLSTVNTYSAIHVLANTSGSIEITNNMLGTQIWANDVNNQQYSVLLDSGSLQNYSGAAAYVGRLTIIGNNMGGNYCDRNPSSPSNLCAYVDSSSPPAANKVISNNILQ